jgi:hypothetical protein
MTMDVQTVMKGLIYALLGLRAAERRGLGLDGITTWFATG